MNQGEADIHITMEIQSLFAVLNPHFTCLDPMIIADTQKHVITTASVSPVKLENPISLPCIKHVYLVHFCLSQTLLIQQRSFEPEFSDP